MVKILHIPEVKGVQETKADLSTMLVEVTENSKTYLVRGPHGRTALMMDLEAFRELQEAYLKLVGQLEARRMALDEGERAALAAASETRGSGNSEPRTSSEIKEHYLIATEQSVVGD
jgi:PHD/YefM family antitoxin component YafN of YafNO toxin-antitoxin module